MENKLQERNCKKCGEVFLSSNTGKKGTNGAFIWLWENGAKVVGTKCHSCWRSHENSRWPEKKPFIVRYEKTKDGYLMRMYRNMKSRIYGVQKAKSHIYAGKSILPKEDFYSWAKNNPEFHKLFDEYERSGYDQKLAPTVDRVNPEIGYEIENMEFVTHSENSRRGAISNNKKQRALKESFLQANP